MGGVAAGDKLGAPRCGHRSGQLKQSGNGRSSGVKVIGVEGIKEPRGLSWGCVTHMRRGEA